MPRNLITDFVTIARSGFTVDDREISPEQIVEMAETYKPKVYKALIWPEHERWFNMGSVTELRAVDNEEGGKDLEARLAPNEYYLNANSYEQKLFSSIEIRTNFRKTGKAYLMGMGATDSPASAGTSEIRFSKEDGDVLRSKPIEIKFNLSNDNSNKPSLLDKIFSKNTEQNTSQGAKNMADENKDKNLEQFKQDLIASVKSELAEAFKQLKPAQPEEKPTEVTVEAFTALKNELKAKDEKLTELDNKFNELKAETEQRQNAFEAYKKKLDEALAETLAFTKAEENTGDAGDKMDAY